MRSTPIEPFRSPAGVTVRRAVREDVRRSFPQDGASSRPFVVEMEVLVGSGRE